MTTDANSSLRRHLQAIFNEGTLAGLSDGQLLERFATSEGLDAELAFTLLMERHGPMVFRVCRSILRDPHEADDAFQATFLILLKEAGKIRRRESVGPWLHGVAQRVAASAQSAAARRRAHERRWFERQRDRAPVPSAVSRHEPDLAVVLHAELDRLPERYRAPIVLCDLESCSLAEAARQLGWPVGTVKSRLNRGRHRLRDRLTRRGLAPELAIGLPPIWGLPGPANAPIPATLFRTSVQTLTNAVIGVNPVPPAVALLAQTVLRTMVIGKLKGSAIFLLSAGLTALTIGTVATGGSRAVPIEGQDKGNATKAVPRTEKAAGDGKEKAAPIIAKPSSPRDDGSHLETITISGRASDSTGQPVVGATIYVINANRRWHTSDDKALSTVITGPDGRFTARGLSLPVWKPDAGPVPAAEEGRFQVAGTAPGFGFTWHPVCSYRPAVRPVPGENQPGVNVGEVFFQGEPIQADLVFGPAVSLHGKVVDDRGNPLAGAKVQVGVCDEPRRPERGKTWICVRVDPTDRVPRERRAFDGIRVLPEAILSTRTGPDGAYRIDGLPREVELLALIDPGLEFKPMQETVATTRAGIVGVRSVGFDAVLDHTFLSSREVRFRVGYINANEPAKNATVRAKSNRELLRSGSVGTTDDNGQAKLRLRPGTYEFVIEPPLGAPYRPAQGSLKIGKEEVAEIRSVLLEPAAVVTLEAVDAKTGAGIEGFRFEYETDTNHQRQDLHSQLVFTDHPATDERGRLRAVIEPGRRRFFPETNPRAWKPEGAPGEVLDFEAGRERTIRFAFTKVEIPKAKASAKVPLFPDDLVEKWRRQKRLARVGKLRVRRVSYFLRENLVPVSAMDKFLADADFSRDPDPAAAIEARFPMLPKRGTIVYEIIDDGTRERNSYRFEPGPGEFITVNNGLEVVHYTAGNTQADVFDSRKGGGMAVYGIAEFITWPYIARLEAGFRLYQGDVKHTESGPRMTIEQILEGSAWRWVVDRKTGFVYVESLRSTRMGATGWVVHQYGPVVFHDGVVLPRVHIKLNMVTDKVNRIDVDRIEHADFSYRPSPLDFVIAPPAGTVIVDYREVRSHPKQGMARYPAADVIAFADGISSRNRRIEPVLKPGQPAPVLQPARWLDHNGATVAPDLTGKVVLIDFWGISCGPCVAQLPEVQTAASHFAAKKDQFMLIGLHDSGGTVDQVAKFASNHALTYRLAIDRPVKEEGWFGATFKAYGVRGIPSAAVIDRQGRVVFVGQFNEALQQAAELLGK